MINLESFLYLTLVLKGHFLKILKFEHKYIKNQNFGAVFDKNFIVLQKQISS